MDDFVKHTKDHDGNRSEVQRLRDQHDTILNAMGGKESLIHPPIDLTKPGLRILDSGCADGAWLFDVRSSAPASHTYFGTDIDDGLYPTSPPEDMHFQNHSIKETFPKELLGTCDLVHQRLVIAAAPPRSAAFVTEKLAELLKPDAWLQMIEADLESDDRNGPALHRFLTYAQRMSAACGLTPNPSKTLSHAMQAAGLESIERTTISLLHGAAQTDESLQTKSMSGLCDAVPPLLAGVKAILPQDFNQEDEDTLQTRLREELTEHGGFTKLDIVEHGDRQASAFKLYRCVAKAPATKSLTLHPPTRLPTSIIPLPPINIAMMENEMHAMNPDSTADTHGDKAQSASPTRKPNIVILVSSLCLAIFCQALDNTIIATAIPRITDDFGSLDDIGWYASSYLLATCAFQLSYGKLYKVFPTKWVFLSALAIFELGSLVCGAAPTSVGLIMGRVLAGFGSAGLFSGALLIVAAQVPLEKRPIYNGIFGAMYAIASVVGPLVGGAFTDKVTWRLCFYINLPCGFITAVYLVFFLPSFEAEGQMLSLPLKGKLKELDLYGLLLFLPSLISLLLALQWGGTTYAWGSARIIVLFIVAGLCCIAFVAVEIRQGDRATIPPSMMAHRTLWACTLFVFFLGGSFMIITYYIPIWFQAIKGTSAIGSGIDSLPRILAAVVFSLASGGLVTVVGYYTWACIFSATLTTVGVGLITTFNIDTPSAVWIGYQIIYGAGIGFGVQQPLVAIQTVLPARQASEGFAVIIFIQTLGSAVFVALGQTVFTNRLIDNITAYNVPVNPLDILSGGATSIASLVKPEDLSLLRTAYNRALMETFYLSVAAGAISLLGSVFIPWSSVKTKNTQQDKAQEEVNSEHQTLRSEADSKV
ncbi:hypothetical protein Q7P37_010895 [Cladosporium fusiforme]